MRVVGLISGGKDSCYNLIKCIEDGHLIVALLNLYPYNKDNNEIDSYMYQTVGYQALDYYAKALDLPLFRRKITRKPVNTDLNYTENELDEVEDLFLALKSLREEEKIKFDAISIGAIFSLYQKNRAENVCGRLGIKMLAYLWGKDQLELLREMITNGMEAVIIKTAAMGLNPSYLGKNIQDMLPILIELKQKYGINIAGEGGEYETLTLDCPLFKKRLILTKTKVVIHSNDAFAPVAYLHPIEIMLVDK